MKWIFLLSIFVLALCDNTCTAGQFYIKQIRVTTSYGNEESHHFLDGTSSVYSCPTLANQETRTIETCITDTTSHKFNLKLTDTYGDSWSGGSHLRVYNEFGGCIFAGYLVAAREEIMVGLLFYTPIKLLQSWRFKNDVTDSTWNTAGYSDSAWTAVTLPTPSTSTSGTQYFRKTFTGSVDAAAYEVGMKYRYGVVAHVNGAEVYRDNMPTGAVSKDTYANAEYSEVSAHNFMRTGIPVQSTSQSVLAIELHFKSDAPASSINFDAWMGIYGNNGRYEGKCHVIGMDVVSVTSVSETPVPLLSHNLGKADTWSASGVTTSNPAWISILFPSQIQFNGFEIWPYTSPTQMPHTFAIKASIGDQATGEFTTLAEGAAIPFQTSRFKYGIMPFNTALYKNFKLVATQSWGTVMYLFELNAMVCGIDVPTSLSFTPLTTKYHRSLDTVKVEPTAFGVTGCSVSPALPVGLAMNTESCSIVGIPAEAKSMTTYTITATSPALSGTVSFEVVTCEGSSSALEIYRYFGTSSAYEIWKIWNESQTTTLLEETQSTTQVDSSQVTRGFCITGTRFVLQVGSSNFNYWYSTSYIQIRSVLAEEREAVLNYRYDLNIGLSPTLKFSLYRPIAPLATWKYKYAYTDAAWFSADTSSWSSSSRGDFPATSNSKYQVYRSSFTVSSDELAKSGNFVLGVRYQYGIIIYINSNEVYRNNVGDGALSAVSCISTYPTLTYKRINLPVRTMKIGSVDSVNYITSGSNTVAIALIAQSDTQTTSNFDASIRLGVENEERGFDVTIAYNNVYNPTYILYKTYSYYCYFSTCNTNNYIQITFNDDRREWISTVDVIGFYNGLGFNPSSFTLYAKNPADSEWTLMSNATNWKWWAIGQHKNFYLSTNKPYNMWKFVDFTTGNPNQCNWRVHSAVMSSSKTDMAMQTLVYPSSISGFRDIELAEIYPTSGAQYRYNFRSSPPLPAGLSIDSPTGVVMGTPTVPTPATSYTISADSISGETTSASLSIEITNCDNHRSLMTTVIRSDGNIAYTSYKITEGRTSSGTIINQRATLPVASTNLWIDLCLPHKFYTFEISSSLSTGLNFPAGVWMNVDQQYIPFAYEVMNAVAPFVRTIVFSSMLPFEREFTDWKVYMKPETISTTWMALDFDDASWETKRAMDVTTSPSVTMYYRASFTIASGESSYYQVLSGHCLYIGGVIGYFNGNRVVRFNAPEKIGQYETVSTLHAANKFTKFSFPLQIKGVVDGKNVMAFEHHRYYEHSTSSPHVFDCTAVFGVEDINVMGHGVETFVGVPNPGSMPYTNLFDGQVDTYTMIPNSLELDLQWESFNLERNQFNGYMVLNNYNYNGFTWSLDAKFFAPNPWETINVQSNVQLETRSKMIFDCPVCMAGYRYYKFTLDALGTYSFYWQEFAFVYRKATGNFCPADGDYPAVGDGQISPSVCPSAYNGYSYRRCVSGELREVEMDKCTHKVPEHLAYDKASYDLVIQTTIRIPPPSFDNIITTFMVGESDELPPGLSLNTETGEITGIPLVEQEQKAYRIYGSNPIGAVSTEVSIGIRYGKCIRTAEFPQTEVDTTATYECSTKGSYVGTLTARCLLGERDGEWAKTSGSCVPILLIVLLVVLIIIIIAVVVLVVVRSGRKKSGGSVKKSKGSAKKGGASSKGAKVAKV